MILARLMLAAVFLVAAIIKLRQPWLLFATSIDTMQLLPEPAVLFVARVLPWTELLLGVLLLFGIKMRYVVAFRHQATADFLYSVMHEIPTSRTRNRLRTLGQEALDQKHLARDGALLAISAWVTFEAFRRTVPKLVKAWTIKLPYTVDTMKSATQTTARLEARLPNEVLTRLKRAAETQGRSLTDFVVAAADKAACRAIEQTEVIHLSIEDQRQIVEPLLNPPEPTPALRRAFQRRRELLGEE